VLLALALAMSGAIGALGSGCGQSKKVTAEPRLDPADLPAIESKVFGAGPVRVVNFWASWCGPCVEEMPDIVALAKAGHDYQVIGISLDLSVPGGQAVIEPRVRDFLRTRGVIYDNYLYTGSLPALLERFDLPGTIPYTMILSPKGEILWRHEGRTTRERIAEGLAEVAPATSRRGAL
jgi:thiol-disulfide isomerase/thioredoxin